jgi:UDPglucose 6-dehydrogenase
MELKKWKSGLIKLNNFFKMKEQFLKDLKLGIVGVGMVGGALKKYFEKKGITLFVYDKGQNLGSMDDINRADIIFVCVPTPFDKNGGFDLSCVREACGKIKGEKIIVIKSTVLPGTTENFQKEYPQHKFLFNPEFLTELTADQDMGYPDRQIVGYTKESFSVAGDLLLILPLAPFEKNMPATEAEIVKYFGNTWFAIKVAFANQMYDLCQKIGANYETIMESSSADKRIGRSHLQVWHKDYRGYGGKCLPKDIKALIQFASANGVDLKLHKTAEEINNKLMEDQSIVDPEKFSNR